MDESYDGSEVYVDLGVEFCKVEGFLLGEIIWALDPSVEEDAIDVWGGFGDTGDFR